MHNNYYQISFKRSTISKIHLPYFHPTLILIIFVGIVFLLPAISNAQYTYNDFAPTEKQHLMIERFESNNSAWNIRNNWITGTVNNGYYNIKTVPENHSVGLSTLPFNIDSERNFEAEALIKVIKGNGGIVLGMEPDFKHYRLEIQDDHWILLIENDPDKQITKKLLKADADKFINSNDYNKITFRKIADDYLLYVNGYFIGQEKKLKLAGKNYGFCTDLDSEINIKEFRLSYLSQNKSFNTARNAKDFKSFPLLSIENIEFKDENGDNMIEAFENCYIKFFVKNTGTGPCSNLKARISSPFLVKGLQYPVDLNIGEVTQGTYKQVEIPIKGDKDLISATVDFNIHFEEMNGFPPDPIKLKIGVEGFKAPLVKVVDLAFSSESKTLKTGIPMQLKVMIQNIGQGLAEDVRIDFICPVENFLPLSSRQIEIGNLPSGEYMELVFEFIANKLYNEPIIPININLSEKIGGYAEDYLAEAKINDVSNNQILVISTMDANTEQNSEIAIQSLHSDIDRNIPVSNIIAPNRYALIIGNEDYSSYQTGLNKEINVDYAVNDAQIFAQYIIKSLGVPEKQVKVLTNATAGQMKQGIAWLQNLARIEDGNAELIFYYSGHGLPEENTKQSYLIPVDVSGLNLQQALELNDVIEELTRYPSKKTSIFIDACFSGGARNSELIAMKGVKIKPKDVNLKGNIVMFSSSSGNESSGVYREQKHGFFTYYLLKKLQESNGNLSYGEWADYTKINVIKQSSLISKPQTPQVQVSYDVSDSWKDWKVK